MRLALLLSFAVQCIATCDGEWAVNLPRSSSTIEAPFSVSISGTAGSHSIRINSNTGTVTQNERITKVVVNFQIPWDGSVLYAFIGADAAGLLMGWAYCTGNQVTDLWLEDTRGQAGFTKPTMSGTCSVLPVARKSDLMMSEGCYDIEPPINLPSINGKDLQLNTGAPGTVNLAGSPYKVLPFTIVDCKGCSSGTLDGGWVEIHAVMKSSSNICLGIFYLQVKPKDTIALSYINCFFTKVADTEFRAQYRIAETFSSSSSSSSLFSSTTVTATATATEVSIMTQSSSPMVSSLASTASTISSFPVESATLSTTSISSSTEPIAFSTTSISSSTTATSATTSSSSTTTHTNASKSILALIPGCLVLYISLVHLFVSSFS